jgi:SAM-dependent methyltransferase
MANLAYLFPRLIRHYMPESLARFMLRRRWIISPGIETQQPQQAVNQYINTLKTHGQNLKDKQVLVFGYGGNFGVGCYLLQAGARSVILCEKENLPANNQNIALMKEFPSYLGKSDKQVITRPPYLMSLYGDIREIAQKGHLPKVDLLLSNSVFEHLADVNSITLSLARITKPNGCHLHFIDLRDHFFKYPFEMLCYSENAWRRWLNPTSNLNRYRFFDYERNFNIYFRKVELEILARDELSYRLTQKRILPGFISGNLAIDSATSISAWFEGVKLEAI